MLRLKFKANAAQRPLRTRIPASGLSRIVQAWLRVIDSVPTFYCEHARSCGRYCDGNGSLPDCNKPVTSSVQRGRAGGMLRHLKGTSCIFGNQLRAMSRLAGVVAFSTTFGAIATAQSPAPGLERMLRPLAPFAASRIFGRSTHRARRGQIGLREPSAGWQGKLCSAVRTELALQRPAEAWGCAGSRITFSLFNPPGRRPAPCRIAISRSACWPSGKEGRDRNSGRVTACCN
jgi:hypothetical protein